MYVCMFNMFAVIKHRQRFRK